MRAARRATVTKETADATKTFTERRCQGQGAGDLLPVD